MPAMPAISGRSRPAPRAHSSQPPHFRNPMPSMITVAPFRTWSLKTKFALCSGALMFAFSVAFTTWTLRTVEADVRGSVTDAQTALVRSTAEDIEEKIDLRRDALTTIAGLLPEAAPAPGPEMDA